MKRFTVGGITREKPYNLCANAKRAKVLFFSDKDDLCLYVKLRKKPRIRTDLYVDLSEQLVKGRNAGGNVLSRHKISSVRKISREKYDREIQ
jgi:topoisomerase-4 subunit A